MADTDRLLHLVEQSLPLGRDEWERLAVTYNISRARGTPERDFESLRRKFKVHYSTRKPTGMPNMPPHIKKAKEIKQTIDDKANVIEMDDEADRDESIVESDFSFDVDPDDSFYEDGDGEGLRVGIETTGSGLGKPLGTDESVAGEPSASSSNRDQFHVARSVNLFRRKCIVR